MPTIKGTETKKAKPVLVERSERDDYNSPNGQLYGFKVTMDNGDSGVYKTNTKGLTNPKFKVGQEIEYTVDTITSDKNPDWKQYLLKPIKQEFTPGGGKGYFKSPSEQKSIIYQVIYDAILELMLNEEIIIDDYENTLISPIHKAICDKVFAEQDKKLQETLSIEYCSSVNKTFKRLRLALKLGKITDFSNVTIDMIMQNIDGVKKQITHKRFE